MYSTTQKWKENIYKNVQCAMNIYIDDVLINPDYILDFKKGGHVFEEELYLGSTPSQYIEIQIYKDKILKPKTIRVEYGILINNALTVAEVNAMLVGTLNGIPVKSISSNDSSFEMIPIGTYNVDDYTDNDDGTLTIKALDNMIKFEFNYNGSELVNEKGYATLLEVTQDICNKAGVELGTTSFLNSEKQIAVYDNTVTAREYISYIAESAGCFAVIGRNGKLYFKHIYENETEIALDMFGEYKWGEEFQISKVSYEDGVRSFKFGDETRNNLWISQDNMYIVDEEQIENIYNNINGLKANSFEGKTVIDPAIDIGDKIIIDGKPIIYQGEMTLEGRFVAQISSKIQIKQKEETTVKKESQKAVNRRVQSEIDQIEGKITQIVKEVGDRTEKKTSITQDVDSISHRVENMADLTNTVDGNKTITLENCVEGDLLELHIYGNNTVFKQLYPSDTLYPSDELYPYGDSRIIVTYEDKTSEIYELGVLEVLRQNSEVQDEYILQNGKAKIIRRVNRDGTTKAIEEIVDLGEYAINLKEGTNIITIQNYNAKLNAKFAIKNDYTEIFATRVEMNSSITQTAEEINLQVSKKVDENEIISKINQSAERISIEAEKINLSGKILNLADNMAIVSNNFNVDKKGNMTCSSAKITGGDIKLDSNGNQVFRVIRDNNTATMSYITDNVIATNNNGCHVELYTGSMASVDVYREGVSGTYITHENITTPSVTQTSREEQKKNFEKLQNGLDIVNNTEIYKYNLKSQADGDKKHIGFIIGKDYRYSNEITALDNQGKEVGVDTYSMISVAYKAIQEQQELIKQLQEKVKELEEK